MYRSYVLTLTVLFTTLPCAAGFGQSDDSHRAIRKYLDSKTVAVGWLDLRKLDMPEVAQFLRQVRMTEMNDEDQKRLASLQQALLQLDVTRVYWIAEGNDLARGPRTVVVPTKKAQAAALVLAAINGGETSQTIDDGEVVLTGEQRVIEALQRKEGDVSASLSDAIAACDGPHGLAAQIPPGVLGQAIQFAQTLWPSEPAALARAAEAAVTVRGLSFSGDLPVANAKLQLHSKSPEGAQQVVDLLNKLAKQRLGDESDLFAMRRVESTAVLEMKDSKTAVAQLLALRKLSGASAASVMNDLKQIALALHNYHDVYGRFPPQSLVDKNGKRLLSWRVLILPFLDQSELYDQFRLDEPWDSEHNLKLARQIPPVYAIRDAVADEDRWKTQIVAPMTPSSAFGRPGPPIRIRDVTDGTSNTIWFVRADVRKAVPWTKPADLPIDADDPFSSIAGADAEHFLASYIDGSARAISRKVSKKTLHLLFSINDGEVIDDEELR